jgi:uncharacterized protein YfbU (UPF0304 family)
MELSRKDRVVLINQYRLLSALDAENRDRYQQWIDILQNGYAALYPEISAWTSDDMPVSDGTFVLKVLSMYRMMEDYKRQNPRDKGVVDHPWSTFRGFDANDEPQYMNFARFLIGKQGKFAEQKPYELRTDRWNSRVPTLRKYRGMLAGWEALGGGFAQPRENLLAILDA